jgi:7-carboxy-7-deazaguanine synthase
MSLSVCEIFRSIQGESSFMGIPCAFVRLAGCNLRCRYCDTKYALEEGEEMRLEDVVNQVASLGIELVEITGGEPLLQEKTPSLATTLLQQGHKVLVETNGSLDISILPDGAIRIMDIKCPSSGEHESILWDNLWKLRPDDEVKFVIGDRHDYEWAKGILRERFDKKGTTVLFSVVFGELLPRNLVEWILDDGIAVRFQPQLHRYIWPQETRGV